jgi:hypothetical protein
VEEFSDTFYDVYYGPVWPLLIANSRYSVTVITGAILDTAGSNYPTGTSQMFVLATGCYSTSSLPLASSLDIS